MMCLMMELVTVNHPDHDILKKPAQALDFPLSPEIKQLLKKMREFMESLASPYGKPAGLAAPQVGHPYRIIFFQIPPEAKNIRKDVFDIVPLTALLNPAYTPIVSAGKTKDWEGCYSVPEKMGEVYRYTEIEFHGFTETGEKIQRSARGLLARIIQHEVGHINGELYTDLLNPQCRFGSQEDMWIIRKKELEK
jgi:peptide deformylase